MQRQAHTTKSADRKDKESSHILWLGLLAVPVLAQLTTFFFAFFIFKSPRPFLSTVQSLGYFVVGIVLLEFAIVRIASFMRRKDREVILLGQRLAEIYLSALRKSALNPKLESFTSH